MVYTVEAVQGPAEPPELPAEAMGVHEAAMRCRVSVDTIRRRLRNRCFPNAHRDEHSAWLIPVGDLIRDGMDVSEVDVSPPTAPAGDQGLRVALQCREDEVNRLWRNIEILQELLARGHATTTDG